MSSSGVEKRGSAATVRVCVSSVFSRRNITNFLPRLATPVEEGSENVLGMQILSGVDHVSSSKRRAHQLTSANPERNHKDGKALQRKAQDLQLTRSVTAFPSMKLEFNASRHCWRNKAPPSHRSRTLLFSLRISQCHGQTGSRIFANQSIQATLSKRGQP
jgi:hypothetical protein